jgi:hypothetical protein
MVIVQEKSLNEYDKRPISYTEWTILEKKRFKCLNYIKLDQNIKLTLYNVFLATDDGKYATFVSSNNKDTFKVAYKRFATIHDGDADNKAGYILSLKDESVIELKE